MLKYILMTVLFGAFGQTLAQEYSITLKSSSFELIQENYFSKQIDFNSLPNNKTIDLTYWGSSPKAEIKYDGKSLLITSNGDAIEQVHLQFQQQVKTISFNIQTNPANYDQQYIEQHQGKVTVEIPEVYELNNIILALFDRFHGTNHKMHTKGQYYADIIRWFTPFKDHRIFKQLDNINYYSFIENAPAYGFVGNKINNIGVYNGFRAQDDIKENVQLMADFAEKSNFRAFYKKHKRYYLTLTNAFQKGTQPQKIWQWLESQFPERHNSYKVFFSPLGPGNHSARMFAINGFHESVMFISGPNRYENNEDSSIIQSIKLSRTFFTEIDHTYVNPTSDKYIENINTALKDLTPWYKGGGYNKPYLVFNEYMTWAVFSLYALENYSAENYNYIKNYIEKFMIEKRGFYKFKGFNDELIRLYKNKAANEKIPDLYPLLIDWINNHKS